MAEDQEKNTGYTGEYGNPVEPGDVQESDAQDTTYSYSYQKGTDESIHSGDYYAEGTSDTGNSETAESAAQSDQSATYSQGQTQGQVNYSYSNQNQIPNNGYPAQNSGAYSGKGPQSAGQTNRPSQPKKNSGGLVRKLLVSAACAAVFGIVAAVFFQSVRYISDQFLPSQGSQTKLQTTTQGSGNASKSSTAAPEEKKEDKTDGQAVTTEVGVTDVSGITEQTMPAIVAITSTTKGANYYDLFGQEYEGQESTSAGSGFIIAQNDNELLIATNNHVIESAKTISVQFIDGEIYEATVKGTDSANDLAVIAVAAKSIKEDTMQKIAIADLGSSDDLKVGEMVVAIGNALGYGQSVTVGYVSAKDREISASEGNGYGASSNTIKAIQTDAAINPGNSGGALINMRGEVIGINSAKIASSTVEGIGYAIPISVANPIIEELMNKEKLSDDEKGYLGISGQTVTDAATAFDIPNGVQVKEVSKGGAADKAGIQVGDIITAINNMEVRSIESLQEKANSYKKGTEVEIKVQRSNNGTYQEKTFKVKLQGSSSLDGLSDDSKGSSDNSGNDNSGNGNSGNGNSGNGESGNGNSGGNDYGNGNDEYGYGDGFGGFFDFFR